jgi:hypothetical protein
MPWILHGDDGLFFEGDLDALELQPLIGELRNSYADISESICVLLEHFLIDHIFSKELAWKLSRWCYTSKRSAPIAMKIADRLFEMSGGFLQRSLFSTTGSPAPDRITAENDYRIWLQRVIQWNARGG